MLISQSLHVTSLWSISIYMSFFQAVLPSGFSPNIICAFIIYAHVSVSHYEIEVLANVKIKITLFWNEKPCPLLTWNSETAGLSETFILMLAATRLSPFQIQNVLRCEEAESRHIIITEHRKIFTLLRVPIYRYLALCFAENVSKNCSKRVKWARE